LVTPGRFHGSHRLTIPRTQTRLWRYGLQRRTTHHLAGWSIEPHPRRVGFRPPADNPPATHRQTVSLASSDRPASECGPPSSPEDVEMLDYEFTGQDQPCITPFVVTCMPARTSSRARPVSGRPDAARRGRGPPPRIAEHTRTPSNPVVEAAVHW